MGFMQNTNSYNMHNNSFDKHRVCIGTYNKLNLIYIKLVLCIEYYIFVSVID